MKLSSATANALFGAHASVGATPLLVGPDDNDVASLDGKIENLNTDISNSTLLNDLPALDPKAMAFRQFKIDWVSFRLNWQGWKAEHTTVLTRNTEDGAATFQKEVTSYNEFQRRFTKDFGQQTSATPTADPSGKTDPLGDTVGTVKDIVLIVGAGVLIYVVAQAVHR